jgi:O-antigen/teichoic acid export membrane protein
MKNLGLRSLVQNTSGTFIRQFVSLIFNVVISILIARSLGPNGNGQYALALLLPTMLTTFLNLGVSPAMVYYLGSNTVSIKKAVRTLFEFWAVISLLGLIIGGGVVFLWGDQFFHGVSPSLLAMGILIFPIMLLPTFLISLLQGKQDFRSYNLAVIISPIVTFTLAVPFILLLHWGEIGAMTAYALGQLAGTITIWRAVSRHITNDYLDKEIGGFSRRLIGYGWKAHLSNILTFLNYRVDTLLLNYFINPVATGIYVVAVQIAEQLWMLSSSVSTVLLPRLSELDNEEEKRRILTPLVSRWVFLVSVVGALFLSILVKPLINIFLGSVYVPAAAALIWLLPGIVALTLSRILANDIAARGRPEINMYIAAVAVFLNVVFNLVLIPIMGINGSALASTISYTINTMIKVIAYARLSDNPWYSVVIINSGDFVLIRDAVIILRNNIRNRFMP